MTGFAPSPKPTHRKECLSAAYQIRYHFGWYAFQRQPLFQAEHVRSLVRSLIEEIATRYGYHVLELDAAPCVIRCLMSLVPENCPSEVTRIVKGNLQSQLRGTVQGKLWSRGWFVRSNGNVCSSTVENYVSKQFLHHRATPLRGPVSVPCFQNTSLVDGTRTSHHAAYQNNVHFVFCVSKRAELIDSVVGQRLQSFWLQFLEREKWECSRMSILNDHVHLALSLPLDISPLTVAYRMLNNAELWFGKRWSHAFRSAEVDSLFQSSFYAGTHGDATTAQIDSYLRKLNIESEDR